LSFADPRNNCGNRLSLAELERSGKPLAMYTNEKVFVNEVEAVVYTFNA
jgi:hypothetical protein